MTKRVFIDYFPERIPIAWEFYNVPPNPFQDVPHDKMGNKVFVNGRIYKFTAEGYDLCENRYPLDEGECEVPVRSHLGCRNSDTTAYLRQDGFIRIDCANHPNFYAELRLPNEYVLQLAERIKNQ